MTLPPLPFPPPAGATAEQIAAFERSLAVYNAAAAAMHAEALTATANALTAGLDARVKMNMSRREMVWAMVQAHPHVTGLTDLALVDLCTKAVDAYLTRFPE